MMSDKVEEIYHSAIERGENYLALHLADHYLLDDEIDLGDEQVEEAAKKVAEEEFADGNIERGNRIREKYGVGGIEDSPQRTKVIELL